MNTGGKFTIAAALTIAGLGAIMAGNGWLPTGNGNQWMLTAIGSVLSAIGIVTALRHWLQSEGAEPRYSAGWALTDPMFMPSCGTFLIATIQVIAGVFCVITSILWAWDIHWGFGLTLAALGGVCFGNAFAAMHND